MFISVLQQYYSRTMSLQDYNLNDMQLANPSALDAQNKDVKTAVKVLKAMKEDLATEAPSWTEETIDATVEMLKEYKGVSE